MADLLIQQNAEKGREFELECLDSIEKTLEKSGLTIIPQYDITKYFKLDIVFGTSSAIDYLDSANSAEAVRKCPYFWGYIENKNKYKRVNVEIARKQLLINYLLRPYYAAIVQKNNGSDVTHPEVYNQSGCVVYGIKEIGLLTDTIKAYNRHTKIKMNESKEVFENNKEILIERIKHLSGFNGSGKCEAEFNLPVIVSKVSQEELNAPTVSKILGLGVFFNTTVRLFYTPSSELLTAKMLISDANKLYLKNNNKNLVTPTESRLDLNTLIMKHYPNKKYALNAKVSWLGFEAECESAVLL